jgi:adenosylcobinamide-phosphate synthase
MVLGSAFLGYNVKGAVRIYLRDRHNHKSPNAAQTESVCAGALGLSLGGDNCYQGTLIHKPAIGDDIHEPVPEHIVAANRLMYTTAVITAVLLAAISILFTI